ncbi:MAG TPA: ABC transporter permease [Syntrophales bacterium]|jgi:phospholipid/cholesterol/gamma-HCH transport system permease protein|nr:ABC transporter permease [Syntrophales bacterium]HPX57168.1 ABC transporter permease [Syntrophales bacterium]HQA82610.1 ABC transporter permease [Syntrophales bacterium]
MALFPKLQKSPGNRGIPDAVRLLLNPFALTGRATIDWIKSLGASAIFLLLAILGIFQPKQFPKIVQQLFYIGARSTLIIILVGLFTGMVLGLQSYYALVKFGAEGALGTLVALSLVRELGPVLTAIMITARAGSAITAEIGIQRISEQIDALDTMRINPLRYLISPRIAASVISFPILTALFDLIGIVGGYVSVVIVLGVTSNTYFYRVQSSLELKDITDGFIKSIVFALIVSTVCCFQGYFTHMRSDSHGAKAVGLSTTSAVVLSCVLILLSDYVVTSLLLV